jgi:hypothetical protein
LFGRWSLQGGRLLLLVLVLVLVLLLVLLLLLLLLDGFQLLGRDERLLGRCLVASRAVAVVSSFHCAFFF